MNKYTVTWEIQIEADSHLEAAEKALEIQRDPDSIATVFEVTGDDDEGPEPIDLGDPVHE